MSIDKQYGNYVLSCDGCNEQLIIEGDFNDVLEAIDENEWQATKKENGEWEHACSGCQKGNG